MPHHLRTQLLVIVGVLSLAGSGTLLADDEKVPQKKVDDVVEGAKDKVGEADYNTKDCPHDGEQGSKQNRDLDECGSDLK